MLKEYRTVEMKKKSIIKIIAVIALLMMSVNSQAGVWENSLGVKTGIYASEGFGSNFYYGLQYNHYFSNWQYFVEGTIGFSSIKSPVLEDLGAFQVFETQKLTTYEFLFGYDMKPLGGFPYLVVGVANINQGGQSKFSYILGLGKQIPLAQFFNVKRLGVRYDIRDQIFKQQVNNSDSFTSHNLIFSLGLHYYF